MKCPCCGQECTSLLSPAGQKLRCYVCGYESPGYFAPVAAQQSGEKCPCCGSVCSISVSPAGRKLHCYVCGYRSPGYMP